MDRRRGVMVASILALLLLLTGTGGAGASVAAHDDGRSITRGAVRTSGRFSALTYNVAGLPEGLSSSQPATNTTASRCSAATSPTTPPGVR